MIPCLDPALARRRSLTWLASYPKSGSTWLRLFLHAYLGDGTADINGINGAGETGDLQRHLYETASPVPLDELQGPECFFLRPAALFRLACADGDQLVKTHCCNGRVFGMDLIPAALTAGALYAIRDPRDVALSYAAHMDRTVDEAIGVMGDATTVLDRETRLQYLATWSAHVDSWTLKMPFPVLVVRYEDMLERPREAFRHVAHFMTGAVDEARLEAAIAATRFEALQRQERAAGFVERPDHAERFFRTGRSTWRDMLTAGQARAIEAAHGPTMRRFGYPPGPAAPLRRQNPAASHPAPGPAH